MCAAKQHLADELSALSSSHKQLQQHKEAADTELGALRPAHAELQAMHGKVAAELESTKAALQKAQEARVYAEVSAEGVVQLLHTVSLLC